jgi:beta-glucosidase-like glycosyl hydrolase
VKVSSNDTVQGATVFPQPLAWAASFDNQMVFDIGKKILHIPQLNLAVHVFPGTAISDEARAISNNGGMNSGHPAFLNCWSPNVNIFRSV